MIIFTKNPKKVFFFFLRKKSQERLRLRLTIWWGCIICGLPSPDKFLTRLTFLSFLWRKVQWLILSLYELSSVPSHFHFHLHGPLYYRQLTLWLRAFFVSSFLIFFSNLFCSSSSFYINMCLHFHTHHSQFLMLCVIQSLL